MTALVPRLNFRRMQPTQPLAAQFSIGPEALTARLSTTRLSSYLESPHIPLQARHNPQPAAARALTGPSSHVVEPPTMLVALEEAIASHRSPRGHNPVQLPVTMFTPPGEGSHEKGNFLDAGSTATGATVTTSDCTVPLALPPAAIMDNVGRLPSPLATTSQARPIPVAAHTTRTASVPSTSLPQLSSHSIGIEPESPPQTARPSAVPSPNGPRAPSPPAPPSSRGPSPLVAFPG